MQQEIDEFIRRMEVKYNCSEDFRRRMRLTAAALVGMEVCPVTRITLMRQIEKTYSTHSQNQIRYSQMMEDFQQKHDDLLQNISIMAEKIKEKAEQEIAQIKSESYHEIDLD